jgi:hypothetical protein
MSETTKAAKIEAFKAKARTLSTPDLLVLWKALKADPETSFSLLLWTGAEYSRRVEAEASADGYGPLPAGTIAECSECGTRLVKKADGRWYPARIQDAACPSGAGHIPQEAAV